MPSYGAGRNRAWRSFTGRYRDEITFRLERGDAVTCPHCGALLEAQPATRLAAVLPRGARGHDLVCRPCRRFHAVVRHTPQSLARLRMQRFVAAILRA